MHPCFGVQVRDRTSVSALGIGHLDVAHAHLVQRPFYLGVVERIRVRVAVRVRVRVRVRVGVGVRRELF